MRNKVLTEKNRVEIQHKYIDHILGSLDFMQIKDRLRDYLEIEKTFESNESLEAEIRHEAPDILVDNWEDSYGPTTLTKGDK
jgi:hypothetical protein